jgi:hypothetical protein
LSQRLSLSPAELIESNIGPAEEAPRCVGLRPAVANQDQHGG